MPPRGVKSPTTSMYRGSINYIPDVRMVESKSLKLYLFSFRNHGAFHEDCVNIIMKDLIALMDPRYIEVIGDFTPRGGISILPFANYGRPGTKYEELAFFIAQGGWLSVGKQVPHTSSLGDHS